MDRINFGIHILNPEQPASIATIAVTGVGRSGTTMVARVLTDLGLFMGERLSKRTHEDMQFRQCLKARDIGAFLELCRARDTAHQKWGFKCPALRSNLPSALTEMRAPRLIVTFRDPLAIALRNCLDIGTEFVDALQGATRACQTLTDGVIGAGVPVMLVSYEKALQFPETLVFEIAQFCGLSPSAQMQQTAIQSTRNGDSRYLQAT